MRIVCAVYRSATKADLYLYVEKKDEFSRVPQTLLDMFGKPELAMIMVLDENTELAKIDAGTVIESIQEKGYFLQISSEKEDYMMAIHKHNTKM